MTPGMLMVISGIVLVVSILVTVGNFANMANKMMQGEPSLTGSRFMVHCFGGIAIGISTLALVGGFIWFLLEKFAK